MPTGALRNLIRFRSLLRLSLIALPVAIALHCNKPPIKMGVPANAIRGNGGFWEANTPTAFLKYYPGGCLFSKTETLGGIKHGLHEDYRLPEDSNCRTEKLEVTTTGQYDRGRRVGRWLHYRSPGKVYLEIEYAYEPVTMGVMYLSGNRFGNENGTYKLYYSDGRLEEIGHYKAGLLDGSYQRYFPAGGLAVQGAYVADQKNGRWQYYYPQGGLKREEFYQQGKLQGALRNYYPDGQLYNETDFQLGVPRDQPRVYQQRIP